MCFLASISNSNVSNELEKSSDWERLGIRKLKNNPDLKEANEGVPQKSILSVLPSRMCSQPCQENIGAVSGPFSAGTGPCFFLSPLPFGHPHLSFSSPVSVVSWKEYAASTWQWQAGAPTTTTQTFHITHCWKAPFSDIRWRIEDHWCINNYFFSLFLQICSSGTALLFLALVKLGDGLGGGSHPQLLSWQKAVPMSSPTGFSDSCIFSVSFKYQLFVQVVVRDIMKLPSNQKM